MLPNPWPQGLKSPEKINILVEDWYEPAGFGSSDRIQSPTFPPWQGTVEQVMRTHLLL